MNVADVVASMLDRLKIKYRIVRRNTHSLVVELKNPDELKKLISSRSLLVFSWKNKVYILRRNYVICNILSGYYNIYMKIRCDEGDLDKKCGKYKRFRWSIRYARGVGYVVKVPMVEYVLRGMSFKEMVNSIVENLKSMVKKPLKFSIDSVNVSEKTVAMVLEEKLRRKYALLETVVEKLSLRKIVKEYPVVVEKVIYEPITGTYSVVLKKSRTTKDEINMEGLVELGFRRVGKRFISPPIKVGGREKEALIAH